MRQGIRYMLIGLAAGLMLAGFVAAADAGIDRELDRRDAADFDFYCNFKKEC